MLEGKTIVVTGAASGIELETAKRAQAWGARVIAVDRREPDAAFSAFFTADLGDRASIDALVERLPLRIDGLANIAGLPPTHPPSTVLAVNFVGLTYLMRRIAAKLSDGAGIVNLGALAAIGWEENGAMIARAFALDFEDIVEFCRDNRLSEETSYPFSKQALIAWTMANRWTWWDRRIRINTVSPGPVETPILADFLSLLGKRAEEDMRLGGAGRPEDIAPMVLFLLSEEARWITGANIPVDGGMLAHVLSMRHLKLPELAGSLGATN